MARDYISICVQALRNAAEKGVGEENGCGIRQQQVSLCVARQQSDSCEHDAIKQ
jgi:hypothetical protein